MKKGNKKVFEGYFRYKKRHIWYYRSRNRDLPVWVFHDERLKVEEEEDYLGRIETHPEFGYTIEEFHKKHPSDFLLHLARIRKVKISNHWINLEIPKRTRILMEKVSLTY